MALPAGTTFAMHLSNGGPMRTERPVERHALPNAGAAQDERAARSRRWALVTARDLMRKDVVTIPGSAPLSEVERVLADNGISGAPVTDAAGGIIGVVSWRDVVERYAQDPDARPRRGRGYFHLSSEEMLDEDFESLELPEEAEETVADVMTAEVFSVPPDAGIREIAAQMSKHGVHRVLVQEDGRFLGILSTMEILQALSA
jgi:CBS domain-containing protein